jgi:hypothetical protein
MARERGVVERQNGLGGKIYTSQATEKKHNHGLGKSNK